MSSPNTKLSDAEVKARLASYKSSEVTDELYDFGKMMIDEAIDRFKSLDTKATAIAAYSIGLITILVSTQTVWARAHSWVVYAPPVGGLIALGAASFAIRRELAMKLITAMPIQPMQQCSRPGR